MFQRISLKDYLQDQFSDFERRVRIKAFFDEQEASSSSDERFIIKYRQSLWSPPLAQGEVKAYLNNARSRLEESLEHIHVRSPKFNPPWLRKTLQELRENKDIIITEADKNMGTAIVRTEDYISEALRQLSDPNTYELIERFSLSAHWHQLQDILVKHEFLEFKLETGYKFLDGKTNPEAPTRNQIAKYLLQLRHHSELRPFAVFYLLMKVHKKIPEGRNIPPGRPIVSSINSCTYFASKFVDIMLQPLLKLVESFVSSSQHLICQLEQCERFPADCVLLCADIESLYPNIPIHNGIRWFRTSIRHYHLEYRRRFGVNCLSTTEINLIVDLTWYVLTNNYFTFGEYKYRQINGTAMGTPLAVVFACFVVAHIERQTLFDTQIRPLFFSRYIDDFFIVMKNMEDAHRFIECFNGYSPTIRCPEPCISNQEGIMLDMKIYKGPNFATTGRFSTVLYQKPQNKYLYLPPSSFHSHHVFPAFIQAEIHRYRILCSETVEFDVSCKNFYTRLLERGYSALQLDGWFHTARVRTREDLLTEVRQRFLDQQQQEQVPPSSPTSAPIIFKCHFTPETKALKISSCLQPQGEEWAKGSKVRSVFDNGRSMPITCFMNSSSIHSYFRQSRKHLHHTLPPHNLDPDLLDFDDPPDSPTTVKK